MFLDLFLIKFPMPFIPVKRFKLCIQGFLTVSRYRLEILPGRVWRLGNHPLCACAVCHYGEVGVEVKRQGTAARDASNQEHPNFFSLSLSFFFLFFNYHYLLFNLPLD